MKLVKQPVEVIGVFSIDKDYPTPFKLRYNSQTIKIDHISNIQKDKILGYDLWIYNCETTQENEVIPFELRYYKDTSEWILHKI